MRGLSGPVRARVSMFSNSSLWLWKMELKFGVYESVDDGDMKKTAANFVSLYLPFYQVYVVIDRKMD